MRIAAAQVEARWGDIEGNIDRHLQMGRWAFSGGVNLLLFPELSLTGYEPSLARELAMELQDIRLQPFQELVERCNLNTGHSLILGVGVPLQVENGVEIATVLFRPGSPRAVSGKRFIHSDEEPFFVASRSDLGLVGNPATVGLAICYELSVPEHARTAAERHAEVYAVSAAKTVSQVPAAAERLSQIAREHSMFALIANGVGSFQGGEAFGGRSSVWARDGELLGQLESEGEGMLVLDTGSASVTKVAF